MSIVRLYTLDARAGQDDILEDALRGLAAIVRPIDGCQSIDLLRDQGRPARFIFIERWADAAAQRDSSRFIPKDTFQPIMAALSTPPDARFFEQLG